MTKDEILNHIHVRMRFQSPFDLPVDAILEDFKVPSLSDLMCLDGLSMSIGDFKKSNIAIVTDGEGNEVFVYRKFDKMKIVTWNCNGALRMKYHALEEFDADLLIVQECEDPAGSTKRYAEWAGSYLWDGKSNNKGIGVFAKNGTTIEKLDWSDDGFQQFLPCRVNDSFNVLAVWTMHSSDFEYIGQFWKYLQLNKDRIAGSDTVLCGDFNSNVCWDKKSRHWNHSDVVCELEKIDIHSMYHKVMNEEQGQETQPTLLLQRKREKPYHIDYAFVSKLLMDGGSLEVGHPDQWLEISDHMPIVFSVNL